MKGSVHNTKRKNGIIYRLQQLKHYFRLLAAMEAQDDTLFTNLSHYMLPFVRHWTI